MELVFLLRFLLAPLVGVDDGCALSVRTNGRLLLVVAARIGLLGRKVGERRSITTPLGAANWRNERASG